MGLSPEARIAARRQLSIDICGVALRGLLAKMPQIEQAVGEHGSARLNVAFTVERWAPPPNPREPNPQPRLRASVRVGKQNAIVTLTGEQAALFGG